ncbi:hypothetical protein MIS45_04965 [Wielerella bovis]|uniref:hypothetical protein n=1 Tax=Wielerella bovis TaxID=2917790 RepID=UPI002019D169|nr:hypothetical protein [Wielerella bovis]ULJ70177.1 hypothetical protein MIS45_04965 [Wielerella bovis]
MKKMIALACLSVVLQNFAYAAPATVPKIPVQTVAPASAKTLAIQSDLATKQLIKQEETRVVAFYDAQWQKSDMPVQGGYYRMLVGKTATGKSVIQDFYQDTRTKQIDPSVIAQESELTNSDTRAAEGRVIWYTPMGDLSKFVWVQTGSITRAAHYNNGQLQMAYQRLPNTERIWAYYPNGKLLAYSTAKNKQSKHYLFDEKGQFLIDSNHVKNIPDKHPKIDSIRQAASMYFDMLNVVAPELGI